MATIETFTGTDGNVVSGWTGFDTSGAGFRYASNTGRDDNGNSFQGTNNTVGSIGPGDVDLRVKIVTLPSGGSAGYFGLCLDVQNSARSGAPSGADQSHLFARYHDSVGPGVQLGHYKSSTSDFTVYDTDTSWSWANGDWLRLTRVGNVLKSWASSDGTSWTELSSQTVTIWTDQTGLVGAMINHTSPRIDDWTLADAAGPPQTLRPDADIVTTGWSTAPLFSKIDEESADGTVITATAS